MAVEVSMLLYLKPQDEFTFTEPAELANRLHQHADELARHLHRVAGIADCLLKDGWTADQRLYSLVFWNDDIHSEQEAEMRLHQLGIDPEACSINVWDEEDRGIE